jgi:hypothetical protein
MRLRVSSPFSRRKYITNRTTIAAVRVTFFFQHDSGTFVFLFDLFLTSSFLLQLGAVCCNNRVLIV